MSKLMKYTMRVTLQSESNGFDINIGKRSSERGLSGSARIKILDKEKKRQRSWHERGKKRDVLQKRGLIKR